MDVRTSTLALAKERDSVYAQSPVKSVSPELPEILLMDAATNVRGRVASASIDSGPSHYNAVGACCKVGWHQSVRRRVSQISFNEVTLTCQNLGRPRDQRARSLCVRCTTVDAFIQSEGEHGPLWQGLGRVDDSGRRDEFDGWGMLERHLGDASGRAFLLSPVPHQTAIAAPYLRRSLIRAIGDRSSCFGSSAFR